MLYFQILNHPCIPRITPIWSHAITIFILLNYFAKILLNIFTSIFLGGIGILFIDFVFWGSDPLHLSCQSYVCIIVHSISYLFDVCIVIFPISYLILVINFFCLFSFVSLARDLSILLIFLKNQSFCFINFLCCSCSWLHFFLLLSSLFPSFCWLIWFFKNS